MESAQKEFALATHKADMDFLKNKMESSPSKARLLVNMWEQVESSTKPKTHFNRNQKTLKDVADYEIVDVVNFAFGQVCKRFSDLKRSSAREMFDLVWDAPRHHIACFDDDPRIQDGC